MNSGAASTTFVRELTPSWLRLACVLAGHRPLEESRSFRYLHVGALHTDTATVVAAAHPGARVVAIDRRPEPIEAMRGTGIAAGLENLEAWHGSLAEFLTSPGRRTEPLDDIEIVVIDDCLGPLPDTDRRALVDSLRGRLAPGALVAVRYKVLSAWSEIAPIQALMQVLSDRAPGNPAELAPAIVDLLVELRTGGALFLATRPAVGAWLESLVDEAPERVAAEYLAGRLRPLSHAQLVELLQPLGCGYIGSAQLGDAVQAAGSPDLKEAIGAVEDVTQRETLRDIAVHRSMRIDLFRLGMSPLTDPERVQILGDLQFVELMGSGRVQRGTELATGAPMTSPSLAATIETLVGRGQIHPVATATRDDGAARSCRRLNEAWATLGSRRTTHLVAAADAGTAVETSPDSVGSTEQNGGDA